MQNVISHKGEIGRACFYKIYPYNLHLNTKQSSFSESLLFSDSKKFCGMKNIAFNDKMCIFQGQLHGYIHNKEPIFLNIILFPSLRHLANLLMSNHKYLKL